jgi:anti-sigma regulatory factor (Ser/Thr protein kinase)
VPADVAPRRRTPIAVEGDPMAVTLTFPADTSSIRLARLVASGFASQLGATVADLDDLRTMVDELCSMLVAQSEQGDEITVRLDSDGAIVHATATAPARQEWQPDELSEGIVRVLADDYQAERRDGVVALVVHKNVEVPAVEQPST